MLKIRLKQLRNYIRSLLPARLPQTDSAVKALAEDICSIGSFPSNDSMIQAIATQVMHAPQDASYVCKRHFIVAIRRAIANQAAYNVLAEIKERHKNAQQEAAKASEANTSSV